MKEYLAVDERLASITLEIIDDTKPDVTMVLLQGIDRISHFLFGCLESPLSYPPTFKPTSEQRLNCQRAVYDTYEFTDQLIGRLLAKFDDDDLVIVVSDHGFEAKFNEFRTGGHDSEASSYGVCLARGARVKRGGVIIGMTVADLTPTVLDWYGLPLGKDMDGKSASFPEPLATPVPEPIPTYDTKAVESVAEAESGGESKVREQLRRLGYLEQWQRPDCQRNSRVDPALCRIGASSFNDGPDGACLINRLAPPCSIVCRSNVNSIRFTEGK